jgi:uncharacterized membrane protein YeaQ/YmgE (transglycosylase-associated protein family)
MEMNLIGWIIIGFIAGSISGWVIGDRTARGCLPTILVGILGAIIGGWLANQMGFQQVQGFIAAVIFASLGAIIVRLILRALESR